MNATFDQSKFDATLKEFLSRSESSTWPRTLNKKALFVALKTMKYTERTDRSKIFEELSKTIESNGKQVPLQIAIASKRASKGWVGQSNLSGYSAKEKKKALRELSIKAWRKLVGEKLKSMLGGRAASTAFIKSGWWKVIQILGPKIGGKYDRSGGRDVKTRGDAKGKVSFAEPGRLFVTIMNTAASRSEKRGGFLRHGEPPLQRALNEEMAYMQQALDEESKPDVERFNRHQH